MLLKVPSTKFHEISFSFLRYTNINKWTNKKRTRASTRRKIIGARLEYYIEKEVIFLNLQLRYAEGRKELPILFHTV